MQFGTHILNVSGLVEFLVEIMVINVAFMTIQGTEDSAM